MSEARHALVTGGGSGVGRAIALALAGGGIDVTICGRRERPLADVAEESPRIVPVVADVTDEASVAALYGQAEAARGPFDIVVANAGMALSGPAARTSLADWQRTLDVNLTGSFLAVRPALAGMAGRGRGRIVFIASTAGLKGYPYVASYVAAKTGVVGLMRALAAENARTGVTVNAVCPGFVETEMLAAIDRHDRRQDRPRRRPCQAEPGRVEPPGPLRRTRRGRGGRPLAGRRAGPLDHRAGDLHFGRRDMVSAPLSAGTPGDSKDRLRLWIRLLRASRTIEAELRERLKRDFDTTLPRFDVLASLYRQQEGMLMSDLSRFLLVSNGNVTGIVDRLVSEGLVARARRNGDRRTSMVRLTEAGVGAFEKMAKAHEGWVGDLLGGVGEEDARRLAVMLKSFRSNWEERE